jgi:hypothetical protein
MGEKEPEAPKKKQSEAAKEPNAIEENLMVRDPVHGSTRPACAFLKGVRLRG